MLTQDAIDAYRRAHAEEDVRRYKPQSPLPTPLRTTGGRWLGWNYGLTPEALIDDLRSHDEDGDFSDVSDADIEIDDDGSACRRAHPGDVGLDRQQAEDDRRVMASAT